MATPQGFLFELSGGHRALDFANTIDGRPEPEPRELLAEYADLVNWSRQTGLLDETGAARLLRVARRDPGNARRALRRAIALRAVVFEIFHAIALRLAIPKAALAKLESFARQALERRSLRPASSGAEWVWTFAPTAPDRMLWPLVLDSVELLTSPRVSRVRVCDGSACEWLFLDQSQKGNRRWCDMTVCGNRAKARRHYERTRGRHENT